MEDMISLFSITEKTCWTIKTASGYAQRGMYYLKVDSFSCVYYTAASFQL